MFGVRTSDRRVVNSNGPADRRVTVVNGAGNNASVVLVNHCEQALDEKMEIAVLDASHQFAVPRPRDDVRNGTLMGSVLYDYTQMNIRLIDMLGRRVGSYKKRLSEKQDALNRTIRDKKQLCIRFDHEHNHQRANDRQQIIELHSIIKALEEKNKDQDAVIKENNTKIKNQAAEIKCLSDKMIEQENMLQKLTTCSTSVQELNTAKLPEQQNVKLKKPKGHLIKRNQSKSASITNKRTCSVRSEPILSKKAKSQNIRNKTYDTNKVHELSLLTDDQPYFTVLGDYNPEKDDSILVKKTSNLELPSWRVKNFSSWYSMEGTEDMTDDIYKNRHAKLEANERQRKRWDMQRIRELRQNEYLREKLNKRHPQDDEKEKFTSYLPKPSSIKMIEITENVPVFAFGQNIYVKKNSRQEKPYLNKWCDYARSLMSQENNVRGHRSSGSNPMIDCYLEPKI